MASVHQDVQRLSSPAGSLALTARKIDEAQPAGHRVYMAAHRHIDVGFDNLDALQSLLKHRGATPHAPWTLLRAVFEAGFWALWVLEPGDSRARRIRGLRSEVHDLRERESFYEEFAATVDPEVTASYQRDAKALGEPWGRIKDRIYVTGQLRSMAAIQGLGPEVPPRHIVGIWRGLSGLQHGLAYASLATSDTTRSVPIPGGEIAMLSINDEKFQAFGFGASWMLDQAARLYIRRSTRVD